MLARLSTADHYARVLYPIALGAYLLSACAEVDFFQTQARYAPKPFSGRSYALSEAVHTEPPPGP